MTDLGFEVFEDLRPRLFSIAYRILGAVGDAEDVVQEAWVRWHGALDDGVRPVSPKAYLSAVVTRLAIDELRSARARREQYVGEWFPEPLVTDDAGYDDPAVAAERSETLSTAALVLLERLNPVQRAVFVLHDVFAYPFGEVAEVVGISEANARQIAGRARRHVDAGIPRFEPSRHERNALAGRFLDAVTNGDLGGLTALLADEVEVHGDGGGKAPQWRRPIVGVDKVARLLAGLGRRIASVGGRIEQRPLNGQPGAIVRDAEGRVVSTWSLDIVDGQVVTVRAVINPDKLRHLGPVADAWALMRASSGAQ